MDNWNNNYLILNACLSSQLYMMKRRAYCKMIHITGTVKTRFGIYQKNFIKEKQLDDFLREEEKYHQLTDIADMMNHSKFFLHVSQTEKAPGIVSSEEILKQIQANEELFNLMQGVFRPNIDDYFMKIAFNARARSNCMKRAVGCVIVKNNRVVSVGYNGTPRRVPNCYEGGCARCNENYAQGKGLDKCHCLHAEESAILEIGAGMANGATLYSTLFPCLGCAKILIQCNILRIVYVEDFNAKESKIILKNYDMRIDKLKYEHRVN